MGLEKLTVQNDWGYYKFFAGKREDGKQIVSMTKVTLRVNGQDIESPVISRQAGEEVCDHGQRSTSVSTHFYIPYEVYGVTIEVPLTTFINKGMAYVFVKEPVIPEPEDVVFK